MDRAPDESGQPVRSTVRVHGDICGAKSLHFWQVKIFVRMINLKTLGGTGYMEGSEQEVSEWDGSSWSTLTDKLCTGRIHHTTIIYAGDIYHMGHCPSHMCSNRSD